MRAVASLGVVLACVMCAACGHTESYAAMLRPPEPANTSAVELYIVGQATPQRPYYEVALVQAIGFGTEATPEDVAHALTKKAASLGCDAVVNAYIDMGYSRAHAAGVCVRYLGPGPSGPAPILPSVPKNPSPPPIRPSPAPRPEPLPSAPNQGR